MAYSVLVECKNFTRKRVDQGVVAQLNQTRLLVGAQCALLISALGLQRGAITLLAEFPHLAHYTIDGLKEAMQSGQLDDAIPLLAFSGITACSEIDELNRLVQSLSLIHI